jgi:16S rRNA (uracil1498-N3)-methyltransferase
LEKTSAAGATLKVLEHWEALRPACFLTLAPAVLKGKSTDLEIEKAAELGVGRIIPLITARSEVKLDPVRAAKRISRWQSVAVEACKQSGNSFLPDITPIQPLPAFLDQNYAPNRKFVASLQDDAIPLGTVAPIPDAQSIIWLVGPEGDFSVREYRQIREHGFQPVSLGANTLRSETAAIVALGTTRILLETEPEG